MPAPARPAARPRVPFAVAVAVLAALAAAVLVVRAGVLGSGGPGAASAGLPSTEPPPAGTGPGATVSPSPSAEPTVPPLPACSFQDLPAAATKPWDWRRTLVDTAFALPAGYVPPDLVPADRAGFSEGLLVREVILRDLRALRKAAARAGHPIDLIAAYRSHAAQAGLFERRVEEAGPDLALRKVARAGHSEHQLGTAVDFKTFGALNVEKGWGRTPTGAWVAEHAPRFGFVQSYPEGAEDLTCYAYEPWHYRYFGRKLARDIVESGLTVREYLWPEMNGSTRGNS